MGRLLAEAATIPTVIPIWHVGKCSCHILSCIAHAQTLNSGELGLAVLTGTRVIELRLIWENGHIRGTVLNTASLVFIFKGMDDILPNRKPYIPRLFKVSGWSSGVGCQNVK